MRSVIPELRSPHPLSVYLPAVFHDDPLLKRFVSAFDDVLAPIFCTLDNLDSYFDPGVAPPDFLPWLAGWVGASLDDNWPLERRRSLTGRAASLYRWRGTVKGLAAELALHTGYEPEIEESGACVWSSLPGTRTPGTAEGHVRIKVRVPDPSRLNMVKLNTMIQSAIPADTTYSLDVEQLQVAQVPDATAPEMRPAEAPAAEPSEVEPPALPDVPDIEIDAGPDVDTYPGKPPEGQVGLAQPTAETPPVEPDPTADETPDGERGGDEQA